VKIYFQKALNCTDQKNRRVAYSIATSINDFKLVKNNYLPVGASVQIQLVAHLETLCNFMRPPAEHPFSLVVGVTFMHENSGKSSSASTTVPQIKLLVNLNSQNLLVRTPASEVRAPFVQF
jgi:hypothetical protein